MANDKLEIDVTTNDKASKPLKQVDSSLATLGKTALGVVAGLAALKIGFDVMKGAVNAVVAPLEDMVNAAAEAELVTARFNAVLKATGGAAGITARAAQDLADALSKTTRFEDEAVLAGESVLLTYTNIGKNIFPQVTATMLDMAEFMGTDTANAARTLGRALEAPADSLDSLRRIGIVFSEQQKTQIKRLVDAGKAAEAQALMLDVLNSKIGGVAEAAGNTFTGKLAILANSFGNVKEAIGGAILEGLKPFADTLNNFVNNPQFQKAVAHIHDWLAEHLVPAATKMAGMANELLTGLAIGLGEGNWGPLKEAAQRVRQQVEDILWGTYEEPNPAAPLSYNPVSQTFKRIAGRGYDPATGAFYQIEATIKGQREGLVARIGEALNGIIQDLRPKFDKFWEDIKMLLFGQSSYSTYGGTYQTKGLFSDLTALIRKEAPKLGTAIVDGIWKGIQDRWKEGLEDPFNEFIANLLKGQTAPSPGGGRGPRPPQAGPGPVPQPSPHPYIPIIPRDTTEGWRDAGSSAPRALASGIRQGQEQVVAAVKGMAQAGYGALEDAWQMGSPPRIWRDAGASAAPELAGGLTQGFANQNWHEFKDALAKPVEEFYQVVHRSVHEVSREIRARFAEEAPNWIVNLSNIHYQDVAKQMMEYTFKKWQELITPSGSRFDDLMEKMVRQVLDTTTWQAGQTAGEYALGMIDQIIWVVNHGGEHELEKLVEANRDQILTLMGNFANTTLESLSPFTYQTAEQLFGLAGAVSGLGSSAAGLLQSRILDPARQHLELLEQQLAAAQQIVTIDKEGRRVLEDNTDLLAQIEAERALIAGHEADLLALQKQQEDLGFLQAQVDLLNVIKENGLNPAEILGGLTLGIGASLSDVLKAMTAAMQSIIGRAQEELGIASPSKVFQQMGAYLMHGLGIGALQAVPATSGMIGAAAGSVTYNTYYQLSAAYRYESEASLMDQVNLMQLMHPRM